MRLCLPLNFIKRYKTAEKTSHVLKQELKLQFFCKDKKSKEFISLKIEGQNNIFRQMIKFL